MTGAESAQQQAARLARFYRALASRSGTAVDLDALGRDFGLSAVEIDAAKAHYEADGLISRAISVGGRHEVTERGAEAAEDPQKVQSMSLQIGGNAQGATISVAGKDAAAGGSDAPGESAARGPLQRSQLVWGVAITILSAAVIAVVTYLGQQAGQDLDDDSDAQPEPVADPYSYTEVQDESGGLTLDVPVQWTDRALDAWAPRGIDDFENRIVGPQITAQRYFTTPNEPPGNPGVFFAASPLLPQEYTPAELARTSNVAGCSRAELDTFSRGEYSGYYALFDCLANQEPYQFYYAAAWPPSKDHIVVIEVTEVDERDRAARERALESFEVEAQAVASYPRLNEVPPSIGG